ncbi:MAG: ribbon-helix-helix protein, CopG family [Verrucomicrobiota bacterium]|nr:ribbon-helix-helix protein, CopG family [Verrucomicrobiota bacterium]
MNNATPSNDLTIQLNLRVTPDVKIALRVLAKRRLTNTSQLMREAVLDLLDKHGVSLPDESESFKTVAH